ncbi:hypothetical protein DMN91_007982 [Ooceraea biroi]|uniref:Uncharacterized protein n=1 Tax=Ooceraea biroi TaxID=2015173 RepID=A0A3L8DG50_OOCBI|nr:hypothetical protein DMN91_007982 [Ooceraea biroi]
MEGGIGRIQKEMEWENTFLGTIREEYRWCIGEERVVRDMTTKGKLPLGKIFRWCRVIDKWLVLRREPTRPANLRNGDTDSNCHGFPDRNGLLDPEEKFNCSD